MARRVPVERGRVVSGPPRRTPDARWHLAGAAVSPRYIATSALLLRYSHVAGRATSTPPLKGVVWGRSTDATATSPPVDSFPSRSQPPPPCRLTVQLGPRPLGMFAGGGQRS